MKSRFFKLVKSPEFPLYGSLFFGFIGMLCGLTVNLLLFSMAFSRAPSFVRDWLGLIFYFPVIWGALIQPVFIVMGFVNLFRVRDNKWLSVMTILVASLFSCAYILILWRASGR